MQKIGTINICGIPYTVVYYKDKFKEINLALRERNAKYKVDDDEKPEKLNVDGYCDYNTKEIHIYNDDNTSEYYFEQTLLHEISHAFLYEIGYAHHDDEEFIDKLSKWVPQIYDIFCEGMEVITHAKNSKRSQSKKAN